VLIKWLYEMHGATIKMIGIIIYTSKIVYITWEITYRYKNTGSFFYYHTKHGSFITDIRSEHPVTAAMLNTAVEETRSIICIVLLKSLQVNFAAG